MQKQLKLLILTQIVERKNSQLGFFTRWIEEIAKRVLSVKVLCLQKGENDLHASIEVRSLGKENFLESKIPRFIIRIIYAFRLIKMSWLWRREYEAVFVHMNQEYLLVAGWFWKILGKKVFFWMNHYEGNWKTNLAAIFADKIFYTSKYAFTKRFNQAVQMPVGVDIDSLCLDIEIVRKPKSVLFLARFDRSKRPDLLVRALAILKTHRINLNATFVGGPSSVDDNFVDEVKNLAKDLGVYENCEFVGAVPNTETFRYYRENEFYVNAASSGMLDKTIFKAAAAGTIVLSSSKDMEEMVDSVCIFEEGNENDLAEHLEELIKMDKEKIMVIRKQMQKMVDENTLNKLMDNLIDEISK